MKRVELYGRVRHAVMIEGLSQREAARCFGIDPRTVRKMLSYSVPPGYVRTRPPVRPKLDPFIGIIDRQGVLRTLRLPAVFGPRAAHAALADIRAENPSPGLSFATAATGNRPPQQRCSRRHRCAAGLSPSDARHHRADCRRTPPDRPLQPLTTAPDPDYLFRASARYCGTSRGESAWLTASTAHRTRETPANSVWSWTAHAPACLRAISPHTSLAPTG